MLLVIRNKITNLHKRFYTKEEAYNYISKLTKLDRRLFQAFELPIVVNEYETNWESTINRVGNEIV